MPLRISCKMHVKDVTCGQNCMSVCSQEAIKLSWILQAIALNFNKNGY